MIKIKTKRSFSGIEVGTTGTAEIELKATSGRNLYKITWDLPDRSRPLVDWFDQSEFKEYLEVIE